MAPYIAFNLKLPKQARTEFEKDLFELMNNSVFGNTIENLRKRVNVHLVAKPVSRSSVITSLQPKTTKLK